MARKSTPTPTATHTATPSTTFIGNLTALATLGKVATLRERFRAQGVKGGGHPAVLINSCPDVLRFLNGNRSSGCLISVSRPGSEFSPTGPNRGFGDRYPALRDAALAMRVAATAIPVDPAVAVATATNYLGQVELAWKEDPDLVVWAKALGWVAEPAPAKAAPARKGRKA